jgi:hypothetical protein
MIYLTLIPLFAILDRWCGGGMGWRSTFRGRPIYYVLPLIPVAWMIDWRLGVILTGWCVWREPAWKLFGGSLAPKGLDQILGTFYRHLLILPVALAAWGASVIVQVLMVMLLIIWAMAATLLAVTNRTLADVGDDINDKVEAARGADFGAVAFAIMCAA